MGALHLSARHWRRGDPCPVAGDPAYLAPFADVPPEQLWLAPPLVDPQVNGFAGVDFQRDDLEAADLEHAAAALRRHGCTRFWLTLITDAWDLLLARLNRLGRLRAASPRLRAAVAGWHLEGPFLSAQPGFHGAHDPARMLDPTPERLRELRDAAGPDRVLLTLAPERRGGLAAIAEAVRLGFTVSLGHTDAPAECLRDAVAAGATGFTHLGNACPQQLDRHDNILWRVLDTPGLTVSLIADSRHVSPPLFRLIHRVLPSDCVLYTTDAMAAAGASPGRYTLGRLVLEVGADRVVRQPGRSNFAGSALTPWEAVRTAAAMLGESWRTTWARMSVTPARWLGMLLPEPGAGGVGCVVATDPAGNPVRCHVVEPAAG